MNSKTDKEDRSCDDIAFLSEIIANCRFWQVDLKSKIGQLGAYFGAYLQYCRGQENLNYQRLAKQKTGHNIMGISIISKNQKYLSQLSQTKGHEPRCTIASNVLEGETKCLYPEEFFH